MFLTPVDTHIHTLFVLCATAPALHCIETCRSSHQLYARPSLIHPRSSQPWTSSQSSEFKLPAYLRSESVQLLPTPPRQSSPPMLAGAAAVADEYVAVPVITSVSTRITSAVRNQCFYHSVGSAFNHTPVERKDGWLYWPTMDQMLRSTINSIKSAPVLALLGFTIAPDAKVKEVTAVKKAYLDSSNFK